MATCKWCIGIVVLTIMLSLAAFAADANYTSSPNAGSSGAIGAPDEGIGTPAAVEPIKSVFNREHRVLDDPIINHGTFGNAPYALVDPAAVAAYQAEAGLIAAGGYASDVSYLTLEACLISFDNHSSYVTDRGGCIYIQSVITGLVAGDVIEVDNDYWYDDGAGYSSYWNQVPYWLLVSSYTHTSTATINNWLIYMVEVSPGNFTAVIGSGQYNLALNTDDMTTVIGDKFKLTRDVKVWQGASLINPAISGRGYTYSSTGISGGTQIGISSYDTGDLTLDAVDPAWVDDDWSGADNGDIVGGHIFGQDAFAVIQQAINGVLSGGTVNIAAGTYTQNFNVNKRVALIGAGSGDDPVSNTVITQTTAGAGDTRIGIAQLSASGLSAANPVLLQDMRLEPVGMAGIGVGRFTEATGQSVSYVKLDNVFVIGTNTNPSTEQERGLYVDLTSTLQYLEIVDCAFNDLTYGWYMQKQVSADASMVQYVNVDNTTFNHNNHKGVYCEKLSDASFTECTADNNGYNSAALPSYFAPWSCGVDINLKAGTYANLSFDDCVITNNAIDQAKEGVGLAVKARDDGGTYGPFPATVSNVSVTNCTISGNERGLRFGEPGKNNASPTAVTVDHNTFCNNTKHYSGTDGSAYGDLINMTTAAVDAENNYWCTVDAAAVAAKIANGSTGSIDYSPWCNSDFSICTYTMPVHNITQGMDYLAIQAAVTAANPGDFIQVDPFTFFEHDIIIDKSLTLNGDPGDATPGPGMNAPVVDGQNLYRDAFKIANGVSDVIIQGFEIRNYTAGTGNGEGNAVQAWVASTSNITIADNNMHDLRWNGVLVGNDGATGDHTYWTIARNVLSNFGLTAFGNGGYGMELTNISHGVIEDNWIDAGTRFPAIAILVTGRRALEQNIVIRRNRIRGGYDNAGIYVAGAGYEVTNATLTDVQIVNNDVDITGPNPNSSALRVNQWDTGIISDVTAFGNKLVHSTAYGLRSASADLVNASGNWWGDNTPAGVASKVSGLVDYTPWLAVGTDIGDPGFQGDFSTLWVDDNSPQSGTDNWIQEAVNMVSGSTIYLAAGTYEGQVKMSGFANLNLIGAGVGSTSITAPTAAMTYYFTTGSNNNYPILFCDGSTVNISNLTVDGLSRGNNKYRFNGISFWNSGGSLVNVDVLNIKDTPFSGAQHGVAVYVYNNTGGPYSLAIDHVNVSGYQKNGFALMGTGLTVDMDYVTATGAGDITTTAQNGIQIAYGANGTLDYCTASGNSYLGSGWAASGFLFISNGTPLTLNHCNAIGNMANLYASDADITCNDGLVSYAGSANAQYGILAWNTATARGNRAIPMPQPMDEQPVSRHALDANQSVVLSNTTFQSDGLVDGAGIYGYSTGDNLSMTVSNCRVLGWDYGAILYVTAGTISASMTGNRFDNHYNVYDNTAGPIAGRWDGNCYTDYGPANPAFPDYQIDGVAPNYQIDENPNLNGCSDVNLMAPPFVGCPASGCPRDTLYLTLDEDSMVTGRIWLTLPTGFEADWSGTNFTSLPGSNADAHLFHSEAIKLSGGVIEINIAFDPSGTPPGSMGDPSKYVARIPIITNGSSAHCDHGGITGDSTYFAKYTGGQPLIITDLSAASATITVDCEAPSGSVTGDIGAPSCNAYGTTDQLEDAFTVSVLRGTLACNSPIVDIWLTVNGNSYSFFDGELPGDTVFLFPNASNVASATLWSWLNVGCNSLVVHFRDRECNEDSTRLDAVGKDVTPPILAFDPAWAQPVCYNDQARSPQYGADLLDDDLNIDSDVGTGSCIAQTGTMWFRYDNTTSIWPTTPVSLPVADYPDATVAAAMWSWLMGLLPDDTSGTFTVWVIVMDCAGNMDSSNFSLCVDLDRPANTFTILDARPTGVGVWLKWSWAYDANEAVEAKIFRSTTTGAYPFYNAPYSWDNFGDDGDFEQNYYDAVDNWILVATLSSLSLTSAAYGTPVEHDPSGQYWFYAGDWDTLGTDHEYRDVYRFVTFVKDVSGNWSEVSSYGHGLTADRSTNYWLGDVTMDLDDDMPGNASSGAVEGADKSIFRTSYFKGASTGYLPKCDIGPETGFPVGENGVGKGIPMPDDSVNFWDLLPFSFNFYTTGYHTWSLNPNPVTPALVKSLDQQPQVTICRSEDKEILAGDEFVVLVSLSGNTENAVKGLEAQLTFNPSALEIVSIEAGDVTVLDGEAFTLAKPVEGQPSVIGAVAAACGPNAVIQGDHVIAMVTFRKATDFEGETEIALSSVRMFDAYPNTLIGKGNVLTVAGGASLPLTYAMYQNYPNPFNPSTTIAFDLPEVANVRLVIFNIMGQEVRTLYSGQIAAGKHRMLWNGMDNSGHSVSSGVYVYRIEAGHFVSTKKMLLTR